MTNFEKITETPEALGEFLASLPVATGSWDEEFHRTFCDSCELLECRTETCPHKGDRPLWWLAMGGKPGEAPGLSIRVKTAFPILWGREYYTVAGKQKETRAPCVCCDNTGKVTIKGVEYLCPRCKGDWREKEVVGTTTVYSVEKWMLDEIEVSATKTILLTFRQINSKERYGNTLQMRQVDFHDMVYTGYWKSIKVYDDYKAAMAEVKRLNAAEREMREGAGGNG